MVLIDRIKGWIKRLGSLTVGYFPNNRVTDDGSWASLVKAGAGPQDRDWRTLEMTYKDAITAWRENFLIRQLVRLQTAYVTGDDGIKVSSKRPTVRRFVEDFWNYRPETEDGRILPPNDISNRLSRWCDELQRSGEVYPILYTNPLTGMSQVREKPACCIFKIETDPEDYEKEWYYLEMNEGDPLNPIKWPSPLMAKPDEPMMLHYTINKPIGATRGESDVLVILPWAKRYTEWLKDRIKFNRIKTELAGVELSTTGDIKKRQQEIAANPPTGGNIAVTKMGEEELKFHSANIGAQDVEPDGRAQRLAIATGANVPLHFLAEGDTANRATAVEMGDPTHRYYRQRQNDLVYMSMDICEQAYRRKVALGLATMPLNRDLLLMADVPDISRTDNKILVEAANLATDVMSKMRDRGWVDDETSIRLIFKFLGEKVDEKVLATWLEEIPEETEEDEELRSYGTNGHYRVKYPITTQY